MWRPLDPKMLHYTGPPNRPRSSVALIFSILICVIRRRATKETPESAELLYGVESREERPRTGTESVLARIPLAHVVSEQEHRGGESLFVVFVVVVGEQLMPTACTRECSVCCSLPVVFLSWRSVRIATTSNAWTSEGKIK